MRHSGQVGDLVVRPADGGPAHRAFISLPYRLYAGDPRWVPPLRRDERHRWSPAHNASLLTRWVRRFVAYRGDAPVGRIAAIEDPGFVRHWEPGTGWFGFFECTDDADAAGALLAAAGEALASRGLRNMIGPISLTTHDETGVLVDGFGTATSLLTPYNPAYYDRLLTGAGCVAARDYHAYRATLSGDVTPAMARLARAFAEGRGRTGRVHIRAVDLRRWRDEARILMSLYNSAFGSVWGFVPITWDEFEPRAKQFRSFAIPELMPIAELDGEPVGFALVLPDINVALARAGGRLLPFGWLRILRTVPTIRSARFILLGVRPDRGGVGIGALLAYHVRETARRLGIEHLELSLVQGLNDRVRHVIDAFHCPVLKTYRLYRQPVGRPGGVAA